jgi:FKBP-type peptidyl-prolyl cis-trans isomerase
MMIRSYILLPVIIFSLVSCQSKVEETTTTESVVEITGETNAAPIETSEEFSHIVNDTIITPSGLICIISEKGSGPKPVIGKRVTVHYTGTFVDGKQFDSSRKGSPLEFRIGKGEVIRGWDEGIAMLNTGTKAKLIIPSELAYGEAGYPGVIPPRSTLVFEIELISAEQ